MLLRVSTLAGVLLPILVHAIDHCTPVRDSCSFYPCLESLYNCDVSGYPLGYGNLYCNKFQSRASRFSPRGQKWISEVMFCLQTALTPYMTSTRVTCDELSDAAFDSHAKCYVDSGFCELPPEDWLNIVEVIGIETLLESETIIEGLEAGGKCLEALFFTMEKENLSISLDSVGQIKRLAEL